MILKGSQRGGGKDLAAHLMKVTDNEHVRIHELRGFSCETLRGAFQEIEATSRATRCRQYLFSLSLSPPSSASVGVEQYEAAIARIEDRLGLDGQPRAIVFHEKEGRRHAHCVWSRIDTDAGKAVPLPFFKTKLMGLSRDLYLEHGWAMPRGIAEVGKRDPTNFTLAEWQQAKRNGQDPRWLKSTVQDCWNRSDGKDAFAKALEDRGLFLAQGDRRSHVVVDFTGEIHALSRAVALKTKDVRARLGDGADLPSVKKTLGKLGNLMSPAMRRHVEESRVRFDKQAVKIERQRTELVERQRQERRALDEAHKRTITDETKALTAAMPKGFRALWARINGQYKAQRLANEAQTQRTRHQIARERQGQVETQQDERRVLQVQVKAMRDRQAEQLLELRGDIGRFLKLSQGRTPDLSGRDLDQPSQSRTTPRRSQTLGLKLER